MANIQLAANLRYLRELSKQRQEDTGALFSVTRQAYSNYETMTRTPDLDMLVRIASYYELTLDQLILHNLANPDSTSKEKMPNNMALHKSTDNSIYLTDEELELILNFRSLSEEDRTIIKGFTKSKR